jgi:GTPase SAR1 family protein
MSQAPISSSGVAPILFKKMSNASQNFTGRKVYLETLKDHFGLVDGQSSPRRRKGFLLYGLGGSGKTQICLKFIEDNQDR